MVSVLVDPLLAGVRTRVEEEEAGVLGEMGFVKEIPLGVVALELSGVVGDENEDLGEAFPKEKPRIEAELVGDALGSSEGEEGREAFRDLGFSKEEEEGSARVLDESSEARRGLGSGEKPLGLVVLVVILVLEVCTAILLVVVLLPRLWRRLGG